MKIKLTILVCFMLILASCKKEISYSCDPATNDWATENLEGIRKMSREDFIKLPTEKLQAAYRVFDKTKRINVWEVKFKEIMAEKWSDAELQHIEKLIEFMNDHQEWFGDISPEKIERVNDDITLFAYGWIDYAKETLGWDDQMIYQIAGTPKPKMRHYSDIEMSDGRVICNCRLGWQGCMGLACLEILCETPFGKGCGFLWIQDCDGVCG